MLHPLETPMHAVCSANDRLSSLPEQLVYHIFSFLDTLDVIRLRVLSRKFECLCASLPYLNFDILALLNHPVNPWPGSSIVEDFKDYVNCVLLSLDGSTIISRLRISTANLDYESLLASWIYVAAKRNIQEFELCMKPTRPFQLPPRLVYCESLMDLKLDLGGAVLKFPSCIGFSQLRSFELINVELIDEGLARQVFSSCPLLENLTLCGCTFVSFKVLDICVRNLKTLTIDHSDNSLCQCEVNIDCPDLVSFNLLCPVLRKFTLNNSISLDSLFIFVEDEETYGIGEAMCNNILKAVHRTKVLKLNDFFLGYFGLLLDRPSDISPYNNLKVLKLCNTSAKSNMEVVVQFLKFVPKIETLQLLFEELWEHEKIVYSKIRDEPIECLSYHVKKVKLINFCADANQLEFVRFLLQNGLVLEKMIIEHTSDAAVKKLLSFHKSSHYVRFIFIATHTYKNSYDDSV